MDIFKIRLNKALSSNRIGKLEEFLLKEGQRNKDKIRKYADYILKNCSDYNWITSYLIMYDGDELIDAIINNYNKLNKESLDTLLEDINIFKDTLLSNNKTKTLKQNN